MDIRARILSVIEEDPEKSVRNVSLKAGLSDSALHKFLKGDTRSLTLETVDKLAEALDVDPRWLAYGEGDPDIATDVGRLLARMDEEQRARAIAVLEIFASENKAA